MKREFNDIDDDIDDVIGHLKSILSPQYNQTNRNIIGLSTFREKRNELQRYISENGAPPTRTNRNNNGSSNRFNVGEVLGMMMMYSPHLANRFMDFYVMMHPYNELESVPTPLPAESLRKLEKIKYEDINESKIGRQIDTMCSICQEEFKPTSQLTILPCTGKHYYHSECIDTWLSKFSKVCPNCNKSVDDFQ